MKVKTKGKRKSISVLIVIATVLVFLVSMISPIMAAETNPPIVFNPSANPATIVNDGTEYAELTIDVTDDTAVSNVTVDLTPIGGDVVNMSCKANYTAGGKLINIYNYTTNATCSPDTYNLVVNATDIYGNYNNTETITLTVELAVAPTPTPTPEWYVPMSAGTATEGSNTALGFGTDATATDGFDSGLDTPHPPAPPLPPAFDAYFIIPVPDPLIGDKMDVDYRAPADSINWTLSGKSTDEQITITWDSTGVPAGTTLTMDTNGDSVADVDMITESSTTIPAGEYEVTITTIPMEGVEYNVPLSLGWNMISIPVSGEIYAPPEVAVVYEYIQGVGNTPVSPAEMEVGKGYFAAATAPCNIRVTGTPVHDYTISLSAGWYMIGSVYEPVSFTDPQDDPGDSVISRAYWYDPATKSYVYTTTIEPAKGYWIAATQACELTVGV